MPMSSQMHTPKLLGEDDISIKYGCDADQYEADGQETNEVDGVKVTIGKRKVDGKVGVLLCEFKKPDYDIDRAGAWLAAQKFSVEPADLHSVKDVEIFSTGLWNGHHITDAELEKIVSAYSATQGKVRPFLKLGHDDNQRILQQDGLPAAGWVENVRKVGNKIVADFVDIPKKIYQLIKNKAYRKVSCEIYNNVDIDGELYPKMLGAVALLGADLPGVMNLNDILSVYAREPSYASISKFATAEADEVISLSDTASDSTQDGEGQMPQVDEFKSKFEQAEKDVGALKDQVAAKDAEIARLAGLAQAAEQKEKAAVVDAFVTKVVAEKICSKGMAPLLKDLLGDNKEAYSLGDNKAASKFDLMNELLKQAHENAKVNFSQTTKDESTEKSSQTDLADSIEKYASENKVDYGTAYRAVMRGVDQTPKALVEDETEA